MSEFTWPIRVYIEDTDAGGIVYYANYFRFMERARTEWLRAQGVELESLRLEQGVMFVVVSAAAEFHRPARYADVLQVGCRVQRATRASLTLQQDIVRSSDALLLVSGSVRVASLDTATLRPQALPSPLSELRVEPLPAGTVPTRERAGGNR